MSAIREVLLQLIAEDWLWEDDSLHADGHLLHLAEYEALTSDRRETAEAVAGFLGLPPSRDVRPTGSLRPLADQWTDDIEGSVWEELPSPEHPFGAPQR